MTLQSTATIAASDTWTRPAQRVRALAEAAGYALDERELVLLDVRELHAVENRLNRGHTLAQRGIQARNWTTTISGGGAR